jgi:type II secretory pathway pseudopilin PulG
MMELVCAFAVLSILLSIGFLGTAGKLGQVRRSYQETLALQAASGQLEQLQMDRKPLSAGTTGFLLPPTARSLLHDAVATQTVQELETGLFSVEATVTWRPGARVPPAAVTLKTLVAREQQP